MLLIPSDVLAPIRPDEHFAAEAAAARDAGIEVALVDHDALTQPDGAGQAAARVPSGEDDAVYRGWMLTSQQYAAFAAALSQREVMLRTTACAYRRAHEGVSVRLLSSGTRDAVEPAQRARYPGAYRPAAGFSECAGAGRAGW